MKKITILGSTGSIGVQALQVTENLNLEIKALAAGGKNLKALEEQARKYKPEFIAVMDKKAAADLKISLADTDIKVFGGADAVISAAEIPVDTVLNAIVGIAGLRPTLAAIEAGNDIALANKETLVTGGDIVKARAKAKGTNILPVDSEHSAVFQSLMGVPKGTDFKILLTASGGPFFGKSKDELKNITPKQALNHPNWSMGSKITIDSATLMNKGLEVIEAVHLFDVLPSKIEVLVHRQSIVHSAVELADGAVIAQLGTPDMAIPIQFALTYPNRLKSPAKRLSLSDIGTLTFEKPDTKTFVCLEVCIDAIKKGGLFPAVANGANEKAVELFLNNKIPFLSIGELVQTVTNMAPTKKNITVDDVFEADAFARETVMKLI